MLQVKELSFQYEGGPMLFRRISFSVEEGEVLCILGPNGIGKTTLLHCLAGLETPAEGSILLTERNIRSMSLTEIAKTMSYVPQFLIPAFAYQVIDYVVTGCAPRMGTFEKPGKEHYQIAEHALERMEISHLATKPYTEISGGERQLVSIARTLAQRPKVILMDEPTAHLDYGNQIKVLRIIKKLSAEGYTTIMTTHNPDHALLLDGKVAAITSEASLAYGGCREIITEGFLSKLYGVPLHLHQMAELGRSICVVPAL